MVVDQNLPLSPIAPQRIARDPLPTRLDRHTRPPPAVSVGAGIHRVRQDVMQRMINWRLPFDWAFATPLHDRRDEDILLAEPEQHLANCLIMSPPSRPAAAD